MVLQKSNEFNRQGNGQVLFNYNDIAAEAKALVVSARQQAQDLITQAQNDAESIRNEMYGTIDFPNAEIKDIIKAISKMAGKNFILDERITRLNPRQ